MELKSEWKPLSTFERPRFNRTFMELKYCKKCFVLQMNFVLIVPLWNWNQWLGADYLTQPTSFNRTFMELKYGWTSSYQSWNGSFNRTFMELKWIFWSEITYLLIVLIVPLWNWNMPSFSRYRKLNPVLIVPLWNWNIESELILNGGDMF